MVPEMGRREGVHVFRGQADSKKAEFGHFGGEAVTSTRTDVCIKSRPRRTKWGIVNNANTDARTVAGRVGSAH